MEHQLTPDLNLARRPNRGILFVVGATLTLSMLLAFVLGFAFGADILPSKFGPPNLPPVVQNADEVSDEFQVFWEVWSVLDNNYYYGMPDVEQRTQGAIDGLLGTLDDKYTSYAPPDVARLMLEDDSGNFEGIGAYVSAAESGGVLIDRLFEDGPAQQAGLLPGDVVVSADGHSLLDLDLMASLLLIRGPEGTDVLLEIQREGEPDLLEFTITRAKLEIQTLEARMLDNNVGYIALYQFNAQSSERMQTAVNALMNDGAQSLVLDLRDNPGGFLDQTVEIADLFLPAGDVLIQRDVHGNVRHHTSANGDRAESIPLVVLVNENSASASEIVAGAIQDTGRGAIIGATTFGKGSVQLQYDLSDGSLLRVTYALWFTPNDTAISEVGIHPDIEVLMEAEGVDDAQLAAALEYLDETFAGTVASNE